MKKISFTIITIFLTLGLSLSLQSLLASWTTPTATPPLANASAPINQSATGQQKSGGLILNVGGATSSTGLIVDKGKVGIGTSFPDYTLDVNGDVRASNLYSLSKISAGNTSMNEALNVNGVMSFTEGLVSPNATVGYGKLYVKMISFASASDINDKLLLHMDGSGTSFVDSSASPKSITSNGVSQVTSTYKFGGSSGYFNGSAYLAVANSTDWIFGTGDFTIDFWVKTSQSGGTFPALVVHRQNASTGLGIHLEAGKIYVWWPGAIARSSVSVADNVWHHVAVVRKSGNLVIYVDGNNSGGNACANNITDYGSTYNIGYDPSTTNSAFVGYMDELRITKGVARWDARFSLNTAPYGATSSASALFFKDGSGNEMQIGAAATPAAPSGPITLIGGIHTSDDCSAAGGTAFNIGDGTYICKMSSAACAGTWVAHQNWSETTPNTCNYVATGYHYWSNPSVLQESFEYCSRMGKEMCQSYSTCRANLVLLGCK